MGRVRRLGLVQPLTAIRDDPLLSFLNLGEDGTHGRCRGGKIRVKNKRRRRRMEFRIGQDWSGHEALFQLFDGPPEFPRWSELFMILNVESLGVKNGFGDGRKTLDEPSVIIHGGQKAFELEFGPRTRPSPD